MGKRRNLEKYIEEATRNIREDRALAKSMLIDAMHDMKTSETARKELGSVAAKYIENLQRSNEQMVKLSGLLQKQQESQSGLTDEDKRDIYDVLSSGEE